MDLKFYLGLQGNKAPQEYIEIGKKAEDSGFSRLYVYDDLFYHPSFPVLCTIAQHTKKIKLGPCLVNGFYRHPALIASNYSYLYELSGGRAVLGIGRGAFYEQLEMSTQEEFTRTGYKETIELINNLLHKQNSAYQGSIFKKAANGGLRIPAPETPYLITATWNYNMAYLAGKNSHELQIAEVWNEKYMGELYFAFTEGKKENKLYSKSQFSIGGMVCIGKSEKEALKKAKLTVAVYIPYLTTILKSHGLESDNELLRRIFALSRNGSFQQAANLITDEMARALSLSGTPEQIAERVNHLRKVYPIGGLLFSPPYGTFNTTIQNLEFLHNELFPRIK
jgi:5,10-methylenetetrahydromethanopterin reductase